MTQLPDISKTVSQPEGPGPSFLNLLPELRNIVYEYCLIIPGCICVTKVNSDEYDEYGLVGFEYPFVLLQTCRTIYHEGVGIYYSQNKFLFGRPRISGPYPDNTWVDPTPLPARFATDSPSRLQYLQHVVIYCYSERINLAPLAKICWARKDQKCIFEFASVDWDAVTDCNMNESFRQIVKDDTLGIRQYHRQILAIRWGNDRLSWPEPDGYELPYENTWRVAIRFGTHSETWELNFHSEDEGKTYKRLENPWKPQLGHGHLPQPFEESVFEKVLCSEPIEIDVQRNKFVGNIPDISLLFVSQAVRLKAQQIFWQRNTFTYKMTLEPTPMDKTTPLYPLAAAPCIYIPVHTHHSGVVGNLWAELFRRQIYDDYEYRRITIEFNLRYDSAMTLADVRIDVRELIRITSHITGRNFFLRFKVSSTVDGVTNTEQKTIPMRYVRARLLELLWHAVNTDSCIHHSSLFNFYINGNGDAVCLKYNLENSNRALVYGSDEYNKLPSAEAIKAEYCVRAGEQEVTMNSVNWIFTGKLSSYLGYLMYVVAYTEYTPGVV